MGFIVTNLSYPNIGIVRFYNGRGTAEQWIKEGKYALNWTRLSCHKFVANRSGWSCSYWHWSLTSTRMIKTGGGMWLRHAEGWCFSLQVLVSREMGGILERIA